MSVRIDSVSVNGLGPISSLQWVFKDINLIYGKNEQGKTFLVEYVLRSLFKNSPKTRSLTDSGQVIVSGIGKSPRVFQPQKKEKIEDLILDSGGGIPIDLARLLVVKGGELSMTSAAGGTVTKSILKEYLSDQGTLDKILKEVPAVVQESICDEGEIIPKRQQGLIKTLNEKQQMVERVNELLEMIDSQYSQGQAKKFNMELEEVKRKILLQNRAKRTFAYQLSTQIDIIATELDSIPESAISQARLILSKVDDLQIQISKTKQQIEELHPKCEHYVWLKSAIEECEKRPEGLKQNTKRLFSYLSVILILLTIAAAFFEPLFSLGLGLLTLLFVILTVRQFQTYLQSNTDRQEVEKIYSEFEANFGIKVKSIVTLKSTFESIQPLFFELGTLNNQIVQKDKDLSKAENDLKKNLETIVGKNGDITEPNSEISKAQESRNKLSRQLEKLKIDLASTQVQPIDYLNETVKIKFDPEELVDLEHRRQGLEEVIASENHAFQSLKQRVCDMTRDSISIGWDDLIENLRTKQDEAIEACKSIKAQIIGGIFITEVISELRKQEDEDIYRALNSRAMSEPIKEITPSYTGVDLEGEELVVFNDMQRFPLSTLSTGAKEQVLLALRIGLATHVLGDQKMFMILDDAFQHSDWNRRERLVDEMAALGTTGWQIIYFSMDDHIKQLFEDRIKPKFKERYHSFELKS